MPRNLPSDLLMKRLSKAVMRIVTGISNSIRLAFIVRISKAERASVMLWPIVNAVTRIRIFFHSVEA